MFQGVKYTQWNLSRSDFLSEHTHTVELKVESADFFTDPCVRQLCGKRKWSYFYNQRFYFCPRGGFCAPDGTRRRWRCWTCVHNPVSSDVFWTAHSSIPFLCVGVYRATLSGRVGLKRVSFMICCEFTFASTGTVLKETKVYFSHVSDSPDAGPASTSTPLSCHRVCLVLLIPLLHFSVWNKKPSWKYVLTLVCHSGVKEQVGSVIWSVSCGILFLPDLQQLQLLLHLFWVPPGFGGKHVDLQWAEVAAKVTFS